MTIQNSNLFIKKLLNNIVLQVTKKNLIDIGNIQIYNGKIPVFSNRIMSTTCFYCSKSSLL